MNSKNQRRIRLAFFWTSVIYASSIAVRFLTSIALSHLLSPGILGIIVIAQTVRIGAELLGDLGIEQSTIRSKNGDDSSYLNTAWTLQLIRGAAMSVICVAIAPFLASAFGASVTVMLAVAAAPLLNALASNSIYGLSRHHKVKERNLFELASELSGLIINIGLVLISHTVWAPILGILLTVATRSAASYMLPHSKRRLMLVHEHVREIITFGRWIALSSSTLFATSYIDRIFLGSSVDLAVLGIYGIARTISDLPSVLASRIGYLVFLPIVAADHYIADSKARMDLASPRCQFLSLTAIGIGTATAWADWIVGIVYDVRYQAAGSMLFVLLIGSWIAVLAAFNDSVVVARGRPRAVSGANLCRAGCVAIGVPLGFAVSGLLGALIALPIGELVRYTILLCSARRLKLDFFQQDAILSVVFIIVSLGWIGVRQQFSISFPTFLLR